jgi:hypothetical protein
MLRSLKKVDVLICLQSLQAQGMSAMLPLQSELLAELKKI